MSDSESSEERIEIEKIVENFDDIEDIPPSYELIMPYRGVKVKKLPKVKITIGSGLNSSDTFFDEIHSNKFDINYVSKTFRQNKEHTFIKDHKPTEIKVASSPFPNNYGDGSELVENEKYKIACSDLSSLMIRYETINTMISQLINKFEYVNSNHNLNERNKIIKIEELMMSHKLDFCKELNSFYSKKIQNINLEKIKNELYKFLRNRYLLFHALVKENYNLKITIDI